MELFLSVTALIVISVGLSELREWRQSRKLKKLELLLKAERRTSARLACEFSELSKRFSALGEQLMNASEKHAHDFDSISKAIDVHGVRLNYKPAGDMIPDYVEGL